MFDDLLRVLENIAENRFAAYADDLIILVNGNSRRNIETEGHQIVDRIVNWCRLAKLQISERKTEAILLKSKEIRRALLISRSIMRKERKKNKEERL